jgi:hypothetical protein
VPDVASRLGDAELTLRDCQAGPHALPLLPTSSAALPASSEEIFALAFSSRFRWVARQCSELNHLSAYVKPQNLF